MSGVGHDFRRKDARNGRHSGGIRGVKNGNGEGRNVFESAENVRGLTVEGSVRVEGVA